MSSSLQAVQSSNVGGSHKLHSASGGGSNAAVALPIVDFGAATRVLEMFESKYTEQLGDRKASAIIRFCKERADGFYYEEIEHLCKMVEYAIRDLKGGVLEMSTAI